MVMDHGSDKPKGKMTEDIVKRYSRIMLIPLLVIILIVIIVLVDRSPKPEPIGTLPETTATESNVFDTKESEYPEYDLTEEEVPEIHALMESYFQAKLDCDPAALQKVFGNGNVGDTTALQEKMRMETEYIEGYQDIICYTKPGLDENSYMVYARFNVKFRLTNTLAPGLLWCYVTKDADGNFSIQEKPGDQVSGYITFVDQSEDVRALAAQVNTDLESALASDSKLASIYQILREGANPATGSDAQESAAGTETAPLETESIAAEAAAVETTATQTSPAQ